jgi:hypothetical protein
MITFFKQIADILFVFFYLKIYKRIDRAYSTTSYSDLQFLFLAARDGWGDGVIVELGAYKGKSTIALALGSKMAKREKVYSVDPHSEGTRDIYLANIRNTGATDYVIPVYETSHEAAKSFNSRIRLIFIDANHEYEFVRNDIVLWKDFVIDGGIMAFHDYTREGVVRVIREILGNPDEFIIEGTVGCTLFISKNKTLNKELFEKTRLFNKMKKLICPWKR